MSRSGFLVGLLVLSSLPVLPAPLGGGRAKAAAPAELKKLLVVLAFDTDSDLDDSLRADQSRLRKLLPEMLPADRYELKEFFGGQLTRANVLAFLRDPRIRIGSDTGVLFFYGGHGATDPRNGHYLLLRNGPVLLRSELRQALEARRPGLAVLMTDCCSTQRKLNARDRIGIHSKGPLAERRTMNPTFRNLFFLARGTVDVTAATENASWGDEEGGIFTRTLCRVLANKPFRELDRDRDGTVTWKEFFPVLQAETETAFKSWASEVKKRGEQVDDATQKPYAFALPDVLPARPERTYAVVGLENETDSELHLHYRWSRQSGWRSRVLAPGSRVPMFVEVKDAQAEGLVLQVRFEGRNGVGELTPRLWKGKGLPSYTDGDAVVIRHR
jgi:hypothetical protein